MLNRVIKVIINKPTKIQKPVFTKSFSRENKQIQDLEEFLKNCDDSSSKFIEQDIKKLKYGQIGEQNVYYELKNSFVPMICLHDLRLKYRGMIAQIDFLAITSKYIYVIECKNLMGDITITKDGEFIRYIKNSYGKVVSKQGMYSPVVQNERHINVIKEILKDELKYKKKVKRIESLVVTANPKTIINKKYAPRLIGEKIIRHDQIIDKIQSQQQNKSIDWVFIEEDMREISKTLMEYHKEVKIDYHKKYSLSVDNVSNEVKSHSNDEFEKEYTKDKSEEELRESLKDYRLNTSRNENMKPYMIFNNDTMEELIKVRPKNLYELRNIKGFGPVKCERYGDDLINLIK